MRALQNTRILDCTLRDGGYINNWEFGEPAIRGVIDNLNDANIDVIECGFIRNVADNPNSSVFSSTNRVSQVIGEKKPGVLYAVMIEQHNYFPEGITPFNEDGIDIIRLTFRRNEWNDAKNTARELMQKGYKVCIQPVGTASYDDPSLIKLLQDVNDLQPYAFYMVDTLGVMYRHEMRKFFYLIDSNLSKNICLGFHSHNNLQMSFANAQEMIRLNKDRQIIIDSSCYGMGRGVGNLATELIADYINNTIEQRYSLTPLLNIVDKYLMNIYARQRWGYDLPYFLSATFKCHPNYARHLISKETLSIEKIEKILSLIPVDRRNEYDSALAEDLYLKIQQCSVDDSKSYQFIKTRIENKQVLILGAGASVKEHQDDLARLVKDSIVISVNYVPDWFSVNAVFVSNDKRVKTLNKDKLPIIIATSNIKDEISNAVVFDYSSLLGEGDSSDNSGAMLIRILKKCNVKRILLAGFDGYDTNASTNFAVDAFQTALDYDTAVKRNNDISKQLTLALSGVDYEIVTPTKYQIGNL